MKGEGPTTDFLRMGTLKFGTKETFRNCSHKKIYWSPVFLLSFSSVPLRLRLVSMASQYCLHSSLIYSPWCHLIALDGDGNDEEDGERQGEVAAGLHQREQEQVHLRVLYLPF